MRFSQPRAIVSTNMTNFPSAADWWLGEAIAKRVDENIRQVHELKSCGCSGEVQHNDALSATYTAAGAYPGLISTRSRQKVRFASQTAKRGSQQFSRMRLTRLVGLSGNSAKAR